MNNTREVKWTEGAKTWLAVLNEIKDQELEIKKAVYKHLQNMAKAHNKPIPRIDEIDWSDFSFEQLDKHKVQVKKKIMDELEAENGWYKAKNVFLER